MIYSREFLQDQLTPVSIYTKLKLLFAGEISYLFESANQSDGNYSFICVGARERLQYQNNKTIYTGIDGVKIYPSKTPFEFLKDYYSKLNQEVYRKSVAELGVGYVDGFIG